MLIRAVVIMHTAALRRRLERLLAPTAALVSAAAGKQDLWERLSRESADIIVVSRESLPEPVNATVEALRKLPDHPTIVVLTGEENPEERARLLSAGCFAVLWVGLRDQSLTDALAAVVERRQEEALRRPRLGPAEDRSRLADFVSASPAMQKLMQVARRVVAADTSLLIIGETGVGKERLARAIHCEGPRAHGPFIALNCAAVPETLLETELFGHERGAFTGAVRARRGYFELAHRGTLFLDEVGDLSAGVQAKLLRVLQEHTIQPVGGERAIEISVRVIAATNQDLAAEVEAHRFRRDLFYRLGVVTLLLPPLRDRREDIPSLAQSYLEHYARHLGRAVRDVSPEAMEMLTAYAWPGNVRELINVIERAVLLAGGTQILPSDLPELIATAPGARSGTPALQDEPWRAADWQLKPWRQARGEALAALERAYFSALLRRAGGQVGVAAHAAGLDPRSLYDKMQQHGLDKRDFKVGPTLERGPEAS